MNSDVPLTCMQLIATDGQPIPILFNALETKMFCGHKLVPTIIQIKIVIFCKFIKILRITESFFIQFDCSQEIHSEIKTI